jgi:UDP-glucose 4-epimerase
MKILITGGTGFVGGRLVKKLAAGNDLYISSRKPMDEELRRLYGNVIPVDHKFLFEPGNFPAVDVVIHLAALNEWDSVKYPSEAIRVNMDETRIILENSIEKKVERFIYFSTAHIYGAPLQGIITEETLPVPMHPYGITHRAAEDYVVAATRQKKILGTVFRLSNAFGAPVSPHVNRWTLLANDLCRQAVEKGKLVLKSNGCAHRDFICLSDVEDVIDRMLIHPRNPLHVIYNLGSGISMRVMDMADAIIRCAVTVLNKNITLELPTGCLVSEEPALFFSIDRLLKEGYRIQNDTQTELEKLLEFCKENFSPN